LTGSPVDLFAGQFLGCAEQFLGCAGQFLGCAEQALGCAEQALVSIADHHVDAAE
jgi:hypothetical protein